MAKDEAVSEVAQASPEVKIKYKGGELALGLAALRFKAGANAQGQPQFRQFTDADQQLTAASIMSKVKKLADKDQRLPEEVEVNFSTEEKALLLACLKREWVVDELEFKLSLESKLK